MDTQDPAPSGISATPAMAVDAQARAEVMYPDDQPQAEAPEQKPPSQAKEAAAPEKTQAPIDHDYRLQMPEGIQLDEALLTSAVPMLKEAGISNDQANKLVPLVTHVQERFQQSQLDQHSKLSKSWAKEAQADREIGGKNWKETGRLAGVALQAGGLPASVREAQQLLNVSGLGNHPAMIRLFRNMGAEIERLRKIGGVTVKESVIDRARRIHQETVYPNDPPRRDPVMQQRGAAASRTGLSYPNDLPKR